LLVIIFLYILGNIRKISSKPAIFHNLIFSGPLFTSCTKSRTLAVLFVLLFTCLDFFLGFFLSVQPSDYYPLLVMQVGRDEIAERSPKAIKRDFRALGRLVEGSGAQVVFFSIPSAAGNSTERGRKTHLVNRWLSDWCHRSNFGFFDHGEVYTAPGLLATSGSQLSQRGKRILVHELAGLIERALN